MPTDAEILAGFQPCGGYVETVYVQVYIVDELPEIGAIKRIYVLSTDDTMWYYKTISSTPTQLGGGDGGTSTTYIRRSDYVLLDRKSYIGIAVSGSLETDVVWTIWITITDSSGVVLSNTQYTNKKWSERNTI